MCRIILSHTRVSVIYWVHATWNPHIDSSSGTEEGTRTQRTVLLSKWLGTLIGFSVSFLRQDLPFLSRLPIVPFWGTMKHILCLLGEHQNIELWGIWGVRLSEIITLVTMLCPPLHFCAMAAEIRFLRWSWNGFPCWCALYLCQSHEITLYELVIVFV